MGDIELIRNKLSRTEDFPKKVCKLFGSLVSFLCVPTKGLSSIHRFSLIQGIIFADFLPILRDPVAFETLITHLVNHITSCVLPSLNEGSFSSENSKKINAIVGLDSRGFLIGPIVALRLGAKFVPVRKAGKLPGKTISATFEKEYGEVFLVLEMFVVPLALLTLLNS